MGSSPDMRLFFMRTISARLLFPCWFASAACTAGDIDDGPDPVDAASVDGQAQSDAGRGTSKASDAGASSKSDAATKDAGQGKKPPADASQAVDVPDAGKAGVGNDAGSITSAGETGRMVGMTAAHNAV